MNPIDVHVGDVIRTRRQSLQIPSAVFASQLDMKNTELDERESGRGRFTAAHLQTVCKLLDITPGDIFQGLRLLGEEGDHDPVQATVRD